ncbi:Gag-Pol polyprotein [Plecturocebus cupreus]
METSYSLWDTKFRENGAHESNPEGYTGKALLGDPGFLGRCVSLSPVAVMVHTGTRHEGRPQTARETSVTSQLQALGKLLSLVSQFVIERAPVSLANPVHPFQPGDQVWVKDWRKEPLQPVWTEPHAVILVTPTALKVAGVVLWVHYSRAKRAHPNTSPDLWTVHPDPQHPMKVMLWRAES